MVQTYDGGVCDEPFHEAHGMSDWVHSKARMLILLQLATHIAPSAACTFSRTDYLFLDLQDRPKTH